MSFATLVPASELVLARVLAFCRWCSVRECFHLREYVKVSLAAQVPAGILVFAGVLALDIACDFIRILMRFHGHVVEDCCRGSADELVATTYIRDLTLERSGFVEASHGRSLLR